MDETSLYLDATANYTYALSGSKRVPAITSRNERTRLSIAFTNTAEGQKLNKF